MKRLQLCFLGTLLLFPYVAQPACTGCSGGMEEADGVNQCCLSPALLQSLRERGHKNRRQQYGDGSVVVGRWVSGSGEARTLAAWNSESGSEARKKFFQHFLDQPRSGSNRAGHGIYAILPIPGDPSGYKQLLSANTFSDPDDPAYINLVLGGSFSFIEQNSEFETLIRDRKNPNACTNAHEGDLWAHFDRWCSNLVGDDVVYRYTDVDVGWIVILGTAPIERVKTFGQMCGQRKEVVVSLLAEDAQSPERLEERNRRYLEAKLDELCVTDRQEQARALLERPVCEQRMAEQLKTTVDQVRKIVLKLFHERVQERREEFYQRWQMAYRCVNDRAYALSNSRRCGPALQEKKNCQKYRMLTKQMNRLMDRAWDLRPDILNQYRKVDEIGPANIEELPPARLTKACEEKIHRPDRESRLNSEL